MTKYVSEPVKITDITEDEDGSNPEIFVEEA